METRITTEQLLQIIGEKQVALEIANQRLSSMERFLSEHMEKEHPQPALEEPETPAVEA